MIAPDRGDVAEAEEFSANKPIGAAGSAGLRNGRFSKAAPNESAKKPVSRTGPSPRKRIAPTPNQAKIVAHVDEINARGYLEGWAWVPDYPRRRVAVTAYAGGELVSFGTANSLREDVREAGFGDGHCGFALPLPEELLSGGTQRFKLVFEATDAASFTTDVGLNAPERLSTKAETSDAVPGTRTSGSASFEGHIDLYGYHEPANGWFFCGWLSAPWDNENAPERIEAHFSNGSVSGEWIATFYSRDDLGNRGSGIILFIPGGSPGLKAHSSIRIQFADVIHNLRPTERAPRLEAEKLVNSLTPVLAERCLGASRDFLLNLLALRPAADSPKPASPVTGCVDGMEGRFVVGWAICDPDTTDCVIEVLHATTRERLGRGRATRVRSDLKALGYGRNNFGFRIGLSEPVDPATSVRVVGNGIELPGSPLRLDSGRYFGSISITSDTVHGSVVDHLGYVSAPTVAFFDQDGEFLGDTVAMADRSEHGQAHISFRLPTKCYGRQELVIQAFVGDSCFASAQCSLRIEGFLDLLSADRCVGWLLSPDAPRAALQLEIVRNGKIVGTGRCVLPRDDLRELYPESWRAGFDIELKPGHFDLAPAQVSIRLAESNVELFDGPFIVGNRAGLIQAAQAAARTANLEGSDLSDIGRALLRTAVSRFCEEQRQGDGHYFRLARVATLRRSTAPRRLDIVIPIYRGIDVTKDCIDSVLEHRDAAIDAVMLVNDCSPEPGMAELLAQYTNSSNVFLLNNPENIGFIKSVNRALDFCKEGDVVLLNSDTVVFPGGLAELWRVAHGAPDIATATAISNNATIFSYPHPRLPAETLDDVSWSEVAAAALRDNAGLAIDVPTGHGFCLLLKREILDRLGRLNEIFGRGYGEENEFCCKAADLGYRHVAAAGAFVQHRESVSFGSEKDALLKTNLPQLSRMFPEYTPVIMSYERDDGLRRARWALDAFRLANACDSGTSFALIVGNWLRGGTDVAAADIEKAVGYGGSRKLGLSCTDTGRIVLETSNPRVRAVFDPGETDALFALLGRLNIPRVIVHQILGFERDFIEQLGGFVQDRRSIFYLHDYYSVCPRVTMLNAVGEFCNGADVEICGRCIALGGAHEGSRLSELTPHQHRVLVRDLMQRVRHVVAPSQDTADRISGLIAGVEVTAVPHPQSGFHFPAEAAAAGSFDNVILLGAMGPHKGSATLLDIARRARLTHPELTFHVLGYTDMDEALTAIGNVRITGPYEPAELPSLLAAANGRLALFLHGWPETFSYTLSEAVQHGLIPLVPDIGAPAARVRAAGFGAVFPFPIETAAVLDLIRNIASGKVELTNPVGRLDKFATPESIAEIRKLLLDDRKPHHSVCFVA